MPPKTRTLFPPLHAGRPRAGNATPALHEHLRLQARLRHDPPPSFVIPLGPPRPPSAGERDGDDKWTREFAHSINGKRALASSGVFILFAFSFAKPRTKRTWHSFCAFSGFIVALFVEMYGFPLTIYVPSGWLPRRFPQLDLFSHDAGHLWHMLIGWRGNPHTDRFHLLSHLLIGGRFWLRSTAWPQLHRAQLEEGLATTGVYAWLRHPQYVAFIAIISGFLLQWPTLLTAVMYPIPVVMYVELAHHEEAEAIAR